MARAHAALAAAQARPGHGAHGLGDEFTFDEVRDCLRSLKITKQPAAMASRRSFSTTRVAQGFRFSRT